DADAIQLSQVEQHPGVTPEIRRGREDSGVTRDTAHQTRRRVVDDTTQDFAIDSFGRSYAWKFRHRRQITGVHHFQRLINFAGDEFIELHSADPPHHFPEQDEI